MNASNGARWRSDSDPGTHGAGPSPAEVAAAIRRRRGVVAAFVAAGLVAGLAAWRWMPSTYDATAVVALQAITADQFAGNTKPADLVNPQTEADRLRSSSVAADVRSRLRLRRSTTDLVESVSVSVPDKSLSLRVTASDGDPVVAQRVADAFAAVYLDHRQSEARASVNRQLAVIDARIAEQRRALNTALGTQIATPPNTPDHSAAVVDADAARSRITALDEQRAQLTAVDTTPGVVAVVATRPDQPAGVPTWLTGLGIAVLFALAGVAMALFRDRTDPMLRDVRDVGELVPDVPVDVLPVGGGTAAVRRTDLLARLAVRVGTAPAGAPARVLLAGVGETAPASIAVELAETLAASGRRTLAIWTGSTDRCPGTPDVTVTGLGAVLRSTASLAQVLPETPGWVAWLTASSNDDLVALVRPEAADVLVEQAYRSGFEVVLFVTPSPVAQAVALGVAHRASAVVVAAGEQPRRRALADTVDLLAQVGVRPHEVLVG